MFDSVRMKSFVVINPMAFPEGRTKSKHTLDDETGDVNSTYRIKDNMIHYFSYRVNDGMLVIELSIPKFLYGNNVRTLNEADIHLFWNGLYDHMKERYGIETDSSMWTVERIDVCDNFHVGKRVGDYILQLGSRRISRHNTVVYNQCQTVVFKNKSSRMMLYDKRQECIVNDEPLEVIEEADGILRFEITPTKDDMRGYSKTRKACELLTTGFFEYIMNKMKVRSLLDMAFTPDTSIDFEWVQSQSIQDVERIIGFRALLDMYGETQLKSLYKSPTTFTQRKNLVQTLQFPPEVGLDKLSNTK